MSTLAPPLPALRVGARTRRAVLTLHIVSGVGLLGDVAAILAINLRARHDCGPAARGGGRRRRRWRTVATPQRAC